MTYLFDVSVLIALVDQDHIFHDQAHAWIERHFDEEWATCPITENGLIRIVGGPRYPAAGGSPAAAADLLRIARSRPGHVFWGDDISLVSCDHVATERLARPEQVTDTYLLALAVARGGKLLTFDRKLSTSAVIGGADALVVI